MSIIEAILFSLRFHENFIFVCYNIPNMRILLIEDDKDVAEAMKAILRKSFIVDLSYSGKSGSYKAHLKDYQLIILDYGLPDMDGVEVCTYIRNHNIKTPILFVTGRIRISDKVRALNAGADDYLTKPFSSRELLARARALVRRNSDSYSSDVLQLDSLLVDTIQRVVKRNNRRIRVRKKDFDLLAFLMRNQGRALTRETIMEHVWEHTGDDLSNTVDVHIKHLRELIDRPFDSKLIKTVHGTGYKISYDGDTP